MSRLTHKNLFDWAVLESLVRQSNRSKTARMLALPYFIDGFDPVSSFDGYYRYRVEKGAVRQMSKAGISAVEQQSFCAIVFVDLGNSLAIEKFLHQLAIPVVHLAPVIKKHKRDKTFSYTCVAPWLSLSDSDKVTSALLDSMFGFERTRLPIVNASKPGVVSASRAKMAQQLPARPRLRTRPWQKRPRKPKA